MYACGRTCVCAFLSVDMSTFACIRVSARVLLCACCDSLYLSAQFSFLTICSCERLSDVYTCVFACLCGVCCTFVCV